MADPSEWGAVWPVIASPRAAEVAAILRSWKDREPRALWEECRAKGWWELETAGEVARWTLTGAWAFRPGEPPSGYNAAAVEGYPKTDTHHGGQTDLSGPALASRVEAVARWLVAAGWARPGTEPGDTFHEGKAFACEWRDFRGDIGIRPPETPTKIASRLTPWPVPLRCHHGSCLDVPVPGDARGFYAYFDGSYKHPDGTPTTGYKQNIYAEDAREYLLTWSEAGAVVAVSDARPLDWLFPGWKTLRIDGERIGQKRTFSATQDEWLTLNRPPAWTPGVQVPLFSPGMTPGGR